MEYTNFISKTWSLQNTEVAADFEQAHLVRVQWGVGRGGGVSMRGPWREVSRQPRATKVGMEGQHKTSQAFINSQAGRWNERSSCVREMPSLGGQVEGDVRVQLFHLKHTFLYSS